MSEVNSGSLWGLTRGSSDRTIASHNDSESKLHTSLNGIRFLKIS
jgi:hypothetical protein